MGNLSFNDLMEPPKSGSAFFILKAGEEARVRFLYNGLEDIMGYTVHEFTVNKTTTVIECGRQSKDEPVENCKWCQSGNTPVSRAIVPVFNIDKNEIQYWKRSATWIQQTLYPQIEDLAKAGSAIASQVFKIKRQGSQMQDTTYSLIPQGIPDGSTKEAYGQIVDPFDSNIIKPKDYDFDASKARGNNQNYNNNYQPQNYNNNYQPQNYNNNNNGFVPQSFNNGQQGGNIPQNNIPQNPNGFVNNNNQVFGNNGYNDIPQSTRTTTGGF